MRVTVPTTVDVRSRSLLVDQSVADQIAKGFRAVGIAAMADRAIKPLEKVGIERNANSAENAHTHSCNNEI